MKLLNKVGIAQSDIISKKAQKFIVGGLKEEYFCHYWGSIKDFGNTESGEYCYNPVYCEAMFHNNGGGYWCCNGEGNGINC